MVKFACASFLDKTENSMGHIDGDTFPFNQTNTHSSFGNAAFSNITNASIGVDFNISKRVADVAVDVLKPVSKKCHTNPAFAPCTSVVENGERAEELSDESAFFNTTEALVDDSANIHCREDQFCNDWQKTSDAILKNPESCPHRKHLLDFSKGMEERQAVQASLENIFQEVHASLNCILEKSLACAVPVHENVCLKMSNIESDVLSLFQGNHERRRTLLQSLDAFNDLWQQKYSDYTSRVILDSNHSMERNAEALNNVDGFGKLSKSNIPESKANTTAAENEDPDGLHTEPDWEHMIDMNPSSRSKIKTFHEGSSSWNMACDEFLGCFDEIRQAIEVSHSNMLEILESAYVRLSEKLDGVQIDIQEHIISNTHRRELIEQALQQVVQQQQTIFSRLMARVGGKSYKTNKEPDVGKSKETCLRAMIPFANMF